MRTGNSGTLSFRLDSRNPALNHPGMLKLPRTRSCFVCGVNNPAGFKLQFEDDGSLVRTRIVFRPEHAGFKDTVHGGLISTVLDEVMVWACGARTKRFTYCAELNVRFVQPARPGAELTAIGELTENRRDRIFVTQARLETDQAVVLATASGKYIPIKGDVLGQLMDDFAESTTEFFR